MAWLQNLAGKAENLLNKIDQNAANVLNDPNILPQTNSTGIKTEEDPPVFQQETPKTDADNDTVSVASEKSKAESDSDREVISIKILESDHSSSCSTTMSEELQKYESKVVQLEQGSQQLSKEILNLQHIYNIIKNENTALTEQLKRTNECLAATEAEMEQYRARAQRVLQEKEKLIAYKNQVGSDGSENESAVLANYLEELKKELAFQQEKNEELNVKLQGVILELGSLRQQFFEANKMHQETISRLEEAVLRERKLFSDTREELATKTQESQSLLLRLAQTERHLKSKEEELDQVKGQLRQAKSQTPNSDLEARLRTLTQTSMMKQSNLETVRTERNALRLQLEKLEGEYKKLLSKTQQTTAVKIEAVNETGEVKSQVPQFMRVSPLDAGVTKKVKRAYSSLDAISVRAGVFLRQYPLARVFVFSYCVLLHFWVIIVLFTYVPSW